MLKISAPKEFRFRIVVEEDKGKILSARVFLFKNNIIVPVGYIELEKYGHSFMTHPYLSSKYRGKGLGVLLYAKAIQWCLDNGFKVQSTGYTSRMAKRVWRSKSLSNYFLIKRKFYKKDKMEVWYAYQK